MKQNVGTIDRIIRLVVGLAFVFLAFYWQCWFSAIIGAILLFSAAIGWCGLYRVLGINTCKIKKFKGIMRIIFKYTIYIIIILVWLILIILNWRDWNAIAALGSLLAALVAIEVGRSANYNMRLSSSVDMISRFDERFNSDEMKKKRKEAAGAIINKLIKKEKIDGVLDFFSLVGILVCKGTLDRDITRRMFSSELFPYYLELKTYIENERKNHDPEAFDSLIGMYEEFKKNESKEFCDFWNIPKNRDDFFAGELKVI